jgi:hypothetical protein
MVCEVHFRPGDEDVASALAYKNVISDLICMMRNAYKVYFLLDEQDAGLNRKS